MRKIIHPPKRSIPEILADIEPRNDQEREILERELGETIRKAEFMRLQHGISTGFKGLFKDNYERKRERKEKGKDWRLIAQIPVEMVNKAKEVWGDDVLTNKAKFKQAFVKDEIGRLCLTIKPESY